MAETASSSLTQYLQFGTFAGMPATPNVLGCIAFYWATDTSTLYVWDNAAWVVVPTGAGASALSLITETVTSGSQATVNFDSIPATYRDLIVKVRGRGTNASAGVNIMMQLNDDTGANYDSMEYQAGTTTPGTGNFNSETIAGTSMLIGQLAGASATAGVGNAAEATIFDYRGTTFQKAVNFTSGQKFGVASGDVYTMTGSGFWRSASAITEIDVFLNAGNFVDGSVVSLYGSL